jgi:hypothetical protein
MRATTVKVEGELLDELNRSKPVNVSLSAFVRSILEREVLRRKLGDAAEKYVKFLEKAPDERELLAEWESADLVTPPGSRRRR